MYLDIHMCLKNVHDDDMREDFLSPGKAISGGFQREGF